MGKKQQVQQRTKGNLQASSSSRAAQLLQTKNTNITNLGFCKDSQPDNASNVDSTLSAAFRKLNKKEAVTKQKALTEILDSVSSENIDGCLPLWARNYQKISIDNDRKIREISQHVQGKIVTIAGRNLAPHLNTIIGPWLEGTCDVHLLTAQIATKSLEQSFTEDKLVGALRFCEKGIVKHLKDRLTSTPATLSDIKVTDPVDAEEKYCRVIGSTLRMLVKILQKTDALEEVRGLMNDTCVWSLGRSKSQQVRKHVYTLISDMCCVLPDHALPDPAYKTLTQQLNNCSHETSSTHYTALANVLYTHQAEFWVKVSVGDVRGQLLDAMKSKALLAGVLEAVYTQLAQITVVLYQHWIEEDKHMKWYEDVFNTAIKCLQQCKTTTDRVTILQFLVSVTTTVNTKYNVQIPASLFPTIGTITSLLSTSLISDDALSPLLTIIQNTTNTGNTDTISLTILKQIKQNEHELDNIISICRILQRTMDHEQDAVYSHLSSRCSQQFNLGHFNFVSELLTQFEKLPACFYSHLTDGDNSDISLINLTNSVFIPQFSNSSYTPNQITQLCQIFVHFLPLSEPPFSDLVKILVHTTEHRDTAFHTFLKEQLQSTAAIVSVDLMIETFDTRLTTVSAVADSILMHLTGLMSKLPALYSHLMRFIWTCLQDTDNCLQDTDNCLQDTPNNYKLLTLLYHLEWGSVTVTEKEPSQRDIVQLIVNILTGTPSLTNFARVLHKIIMWDPSWSEPILDRVTGFLDSSNLNRINKDLLRVFGKRPKHVILYFTEKLPARTASTAHLMDLYERFGVFCISGVRNVTSGENGRGTNPVFLECCQEFVAQCTLSDESDEMLEKALCNLISQGYLEIDSTKMESSVLDRMMNNRRLIYALINEFVWSNNILVLYFVKDLLERGFVVDWGRVEGTASLPLDTLVNLSAVFGDKSFVDVIEGRMEGELTKQQRLFALDHLVFTIKTAPLSDLLEFLSDSCLEGDLMDLELISEIFSTFRHIFVCPDGTCEDDIEFVLCSTATVIQATLDIVSSGPSPHSYHLTAALCSFKQLYISMKHGLKTDSKHHKFQEDWELFFEPGIQDLVLVLHDKLVEQELFDVVKYLSSVVMLAPNCSVKSFMKYAIKRSDCITFEECFAYLMSCYEAVNMCYETQTALFYLLLHCQDTFEMRPEEEMVEEDTAEEEVEFLSPPKIFLDALSGVDHDYAENEQEYEFKLLKTAHIWILLLRCECSRTTDVIREHVEYLRSKRILSQFLDELVYFIKFSARKYEIVPLGEITQCDSFEAHQVASSCFMGIATVFPALLRNWWKKLDKEMTISVEKFVTAFVSPTLIKLETKLQNKPDKTLTIKPRPIVREVVATYSMDDITADLVINIASNHPLSPPTVSCERQVGVPVATWRSWMLQMTAMFQNQNSSIVDALEHWRKNMDNQFEGLESCMICFSVVQGPKKLIPKPCCKTCKKKFHSACLYKWFSTSGKSSCPMCRSSFTHSSGLRARLQETHEHADYEGQ